MSDKKSSVSSERLNESSLPLLEEGKEGVGGDVEVLEMKEKDAHSEGSGREKDDSNPEKKEGEEEEGKKSEKKKKEKKEKQKKTPKPRRNRNIMQGLTLGLNLLDRDDKKINDAVNLSFEDVLAEPDQTHGADGVWRLAFLIFAFTKRWVYCILAALLAIPLAIIWGLLFGLLTLLHIWIVSPLIKATEVALVVLRRLWGAVVRATVEPLCIGIGAVCPKNRTAETWDKLDDSHNIV